MKGSDRNQVVLANYLLFESQIMFSRHDTNRVCVPHDTAPSLNADNAGTLLDDSQFDTVVNTPFQTTVDIFLPYLDVEVGLALWE